MYRHHTTKGWGAQIGVGIDYKTQSEIGPGCIVLWACNLKTISLLYKNKLFLNGGIMGRKRIKAIQTTPLSQKLIELRAKTGDSREELGARVGVSATYIGMLESGERQPSRDLVLKLADVCFSSSQKHQIDELLLLAGYSPLHMPALHTPQDPLALKAEAAESEQANFQAFSAWIIELLKNNHFEEAQQALQMGFQRFQAHVQLQSLVAMLELSRGHYQEAILSQNSAIEAYQENPPLQVTLADLKLNLGEMYFLKAVHQAELSQADRIQDLQRACAILAEASALDREDVYILDEFARCSFNLALLLEGSEAVSCWQVCVGAFETVLGAENKQVLGQVVLNEASLFLALAYAKLGQFQQAFFILDLVSTYLPEHWLLHYVRAVCLCLSYQQNADPALLERASAALRKALRDPEPGNRSAAEAPDDPDLAVLRESDPLLLQALNSKHEEQAR